LKNITYLFGAGASVGSLPIVEQFPKRISEFIKTIKEEKYKLPENESYGEELNINPKKSKYQTQTEFISNLRWLYEECKRHESIDTFAKKLFISNENDQLLKLKATLSAYLIFEQARNSIDMRYDSFFASIIKYSIQNLPKNLKILSWNYDFQFEKAFSSYTNNSELGFNQDMLHVFTKFSKNYPINDNFSICKINGTTSFFTQRSSQRYFFSDLNEQFKIKLIELVLSNYFGLLNMEDKFHSGLSFAWEKWEEKSDFNIIKRSIACTENTDILVVIGYSFPFFNRDVDRKIIGSMKKLNKIYFQSINPNNIKERFLSIRNDIIEKNLISISNVRQFYLPNEM